MASVFKPKGSSKYVILYFDENGDRRKKAGTTDKAVSERIARDIENRVALRKEGLVDPKAEAYRDSQDLPLTDHLDRLDRNPSKPRMRRPSTSSCSPLAHGESWRSW